MKSEYWCPFCSKKKVRFWTMMRRSDILFKGEKVIISEKDTTAYSRAIFKCSNCEFVYVGPKSEMMRYINK